MSQNSQVSRIVFIMVFLLFKCFKLLSKCDYLFPKSLFMHLFFVDQVMFSYHSDQKS